MAGVITKGPVWILMEKEGNEQITDEGPKRDSAYDQGLCTGR